MTCHGMTPRSRLFPPIPLPNGVADQTGLEDRNLGTGEPLDSPIRPAIEERPDISHKKTTSNDDVASLRLDCAGFQTRLLLTLVKHTIVNIYLYYCNIYMRDIFRI